MEDDLVEEIIIRYHKVLFTEISSVREAFFMLFHEMEDNKYIFKCLVALYKCFIAICPPLLKAARNFAVLLRPSLRRNTQLLQEEQPYIPHPTQNE